MTQISGPIANQTFTDAQWRYIHGSEAGIVGDINGSSYAYELSTNSDAFVVGSSSQDSISVVAGFLHGILAGQSQSVTIPAPVSADRTDVVVVRYDPTYVVDVPNVGDTAPCRLAVVSGTEGAGVPAHDATPPGAEDLPLYDVTRRIVSGQVQSLAQATVRDRRTRTSIGLLVETPADLPSSAPLSTRVHVQSTGDDSIRVLDAQDSPVWRAPSSMFGVGTALVGTPPVGARFLRQAGYRTITTQLDGAAIVEFPASFPSGLLSVHATLFAGVGAATPVPATVVVYAPQALSARRPGLGSFHVIVYALDGTPYANGTFGIGYDAVGW